MGDSYGVDLNAVEDPLLRQRFMQLQVVLVCPLIVCEFCACRMCLFVTRSVSPFSGCLTCLCSRLSCINLHHVSPTDAHTCACLLYVPYLSFASHMCLVGMSSVPVLCMSNVCSSCKHMIKSFDRCAGQTLHPGSDLLTYLAQK